MHQRLHRYIPHFDYISGSSNHIADALSRRFDEPWSHCAHSLCSHFLPQVTGFQRWIPSKLIASAVISALHRLPSCSESLDELLAPPQHGTNGSSLPVTWASTPFSKPSKTKFLSYKSSPNKFIQENLQPTAIPSSLGQLKITCGALRVAQTFLHVGANDSPPELFASIDFRLQRTLKPGNRPTPLHSESSPSLSRLFNILPPSPKQQEPTFQSSVPPST